MRDYRSFVNHSEGKAVCIPKAPSKEDAAAWFQKTQMPYGSVTQPELEGEHGVIEAV